MRRRALPRSEIIYFCDKLGLFRRKKYVRRYHRCEIVASETRAFPTEPTRVPKKSVEFPNYLVEYFCLPIVLTQIPIEATCSLRNSARFEISVSKQRHRAQFRSIRADFFWRRIGDSIKAPLSKTAALSKNLRFWKKRKKNVQRNAHRLIARRHVTNRRQFPFSNFSRVFRTRCK